ncbi:hypothetical protein PR048_030813 [Dryococelus australis]|uniref:Uncharacterized protein n=1 Tax=Dryococelus australis TaxID=614101 RepID=A0ABQ9GA19_9NEOP|nr:hypothetical protein PR048_030813 [Dryococelus australis]
MSISEGIGGDGFSRLLDSNRGESLQWFLRSKVHGVEVRVRVKGHTGQSGRLETPLARRTVRGKVIYSGTQPPETAVGQTSRGSDWLMEMLPAGSRRPSSARFTPGSFCAGDITRTRIASRTQMWVASTCREHEWRTPLSLVTATFNTLRTLRGVKQRPKIAYSCAMYTIVCSIPGRVTGFSQVGIMPDDAVGRRVFSGISLPPPPLHSDAAPHSFQSPSLLNTISAYTRQKAKSRYRNRIRLERASQKQSSNTHETRYDRVKRRRERKINIKSSERVNTAGSRVEATVTGRRRGQSSSLEVTAGSWDYDGRKPPDLLLYSLRRPLRRLEERPSRQPTLFHGPPRPSHVAWTHLLTRQARSESPISTTARTPVLLVSVVELTIVLLVHTTPGTTLYCAAFIIGRCSPQFAATSTTALVSLSRKAMHGILFSSRRLLACVLSESVAGNKKCHRYLIPRRLQSPPRQDCSVPCGVNPRFPCVKRLGSPLVDDRPIMNAVKYRVVSGVVWTNRTMVSSNTDTNRTGVLAAVDIGYSLLICRKCQSMGEDNRRFLRKSVERRHRPARFHTCENPPGIKTGSPRWKASSLTTTPTWPYTGPLSRQGKCRGVLVRWRVRGRRDSFLLAGTLLTAVHDRVSTFEINLRNKFTAPTCMYFNGALVGMRRVKRCKRDCGAIANRLLNSRNFPTATYRRSSRRNSQPDDGEGGALWVSRGEDPQVPVIVCAWKHYPAPSISAGSHQLRLYAVVISQTRQEAAVPEMIKYSPPTKANRVKSPAGSLPEFRKWESCRTILLVSRFPRGSPIFLPPLHSGTGAAVAERLARSPPT